MVRSVLTGTTGAPGVAAGRILWVAAPAPPPEPSGPAADGEEDRLMAAFGAAAEELEGIAAATADRAGPEVGAIFEAQAAFARDPGLIDPAIAYVRDGAGAVPAVERAAAEGAATLAGLDDPYFRERAADIRDVGRRVVARLTGRPEPALAHPDGTAAILAADDFDPSIVAALRPELVAGLATSGGATNGHAAIVARAMGIPLVLGLGDSLGAALDGSDALLDGRTGRLILDPGLAELRDALASAEVTSPTAGAATVVALPVRIEANVGSVREARSAAHAAAEGIGLVRTELLFLGRSVPPGVDEQRATYAGILAAIGDRPCVFRTLDIGGDKPAAWAGTETEMNPALGVRGLRLGLRRGDLFEAQIRALLEASDGRPLDLLLPMVSTVEEVLAAREIVNGVAGGAPVRLGVMIEVPSAAVMAEALAEITDFFSIGTNDLVQYTMAADRTSPALAELATPLQPAVLRLIGSVTEAAVALGRPVTVCGEAAADPYAAALLVGLGVTALSVTPSSIAAVRSLVAGLDLGACRVAAVQAREARTVADVRSIAEGLLGPPGRSAG